MRQSNYDVGLSQFVAIVNRIVSARQTSRIYYLLLKLPRRKPLIRETKLGFIYYSGPLDDLAYSCRWDFRDYEPLTRRAFTLVAQRCATVVDVGAYTGLYTLHAATAGSPQRIWAIEPNAQIRSNLEGNIGLNDLSHMVEVLGFGLGSTQSERFFYPQSGNSYSAASSFDYSFSSRHSSSDPREHAVSVSLYTLDEVFRNVAIDLIKIDVEGLEFEVLLGGRQTLETQGPVVFVEILGQDRFHKVENLMANLGYSPGIPLGNRLGDERNFMYWKGRFELLQEVLDELSKQPATPSGPTSTHFSNF